MEKLRIEDDSSDYWDVCQAIAQHFGGICPVRIVGIQEAPNPVTLILSPTHRNLSRIFSFCAYQRSSLSPVIQVLEDRYQLCRSELILPKEQPRWVVYSPSHEQYSHESIEQVGTKCKVQPIHRFSMRCSCLVPTVDGSRVSNTETSTDSPRICPE